MIISAMYTDIGKRNGNEDALLCLPLQKDQMLLAVADGMGGHRAGEVASRLAVDTLRAYCNRPFSESFAAVNHAIFEKAQCDEDCRGMGTTLVAARVDTRECSIAYVGDSRIYHWDGLVLRQQSEDHSYVAELMRRGMLTREEARSHPHRNRILRALGTDSEVKADYKRFSWKRGDLLLLCSDGLHDTLRDAELAAILQSEEDINAKAARLIREALFAGASDNITVVLAKNGEDAK